MPTRAKPDPTDRACEACGTPLRRKRYGGRLEDRGVFLRRRNCSQSCANSRQEVTKDAHHWRARKHRRNACQECGATSALHVHHNDRDPANNDPANLTTLCASCHLRRHWREDRDRRMAAVAGAQRGARTQPRSTDGRWCSAG